MFKPNITKKNYASPLFNGFLIIKRNVFFLIKGTYPIITYLSSHEKQNMDDVSDFKILISATSNDKDNASHYV